eukprot:3313147-Rhodomonas_salina.1
MARAVQGYESGTELARMVLPGPSTRLGLPPLSHPPRYSNSAMAYALAMPQLRYGLRARYAMPGTALPHTSSVLALRMQLRYCPTRVLCDARYYAVIWCYEALCDVRYSAMVCCYALAMRCPCSFRSLAWARLSRSRALSPYALATRCPVLIYRNAISLRACYAMSCTDVMFGTIGLRACYALPGTDILHAATTYAMPGTERAYGGSSRRSYR